MKKTVLITSSIIIALSLAGCSAGKNQPETANKSTTAAANVTPATATTEAKDQQQTTDAPKQQPTAAEQTKAEIDYAFTKDNGHPEKVLIGVINGAKTNLDIAIYSLTNKDIVAAILDAKKRGVTVRVMTDQQEVKAAAQAEKFKQLKAAGIPIKENIHKGLMHLKVTIADKSVITTGSFNYTAASAATNDEVVVAIHEAKLAQEWDSEFEKMWTDKKNYQELK
ncbi:phospholipase D-like domain-containing protein [Paenibacillus sp. GCM10027628]|uniref:phospholipase D-like domain-containing protein n=1 Tax=Paenibacillus sp. GCM10027628 TaxID=3273413 RepID=UPI00362B628C